MTKQFQNMDESQDFWCSYQSVKKAIESLQGDRAAALRALVMYGDHPLEWMEQKDAEWQKPLWQQAGKTHDWRNHVPDEVRAVWASFPAKHKFVLFQWAEKLADAEHWD